MYYTNIVMGAIMEKNMISEDEYNKLLKKSRSSVGDVNAIIEVYNYLKNKTLKLYNGVFVKAHIYFLDNLFLRTLSPRCHGFSKTDEEFIKSTFLANEFKELIYLNIKDYNYSEELKELLTGDKHFNDFTKEEIKRIMNFDVSDGNRERYNRYCYHLTNYLFVLDGLGVIQYLKEAYGDNLPIEMLKRSNVCISAFYYSGYGVDYSILGDKHLFSLYRKFVKYYPDKVEEFLKFVDSIDLLTATEFVKNYMTFVRNGLDSNFIIENGNVSIDGLEGNKRDTLGPISVFSVFRNRGSGDDEFDKKWDKRSSDIIKRDFEKLVNSYNEEKGYAKTLTTDKKY